MDLIDFLSVILHSTGIQRIIVKPTKHSGIILPQNTSYLVLKGTEIDKNGNIILYVEPNF